MASSNFCPLFLIAFSTLFAVVFLPETAAQISAMYPFSCSNTITKCNSFLYHHSGDLTKEDVAAFYSVNVSQIRPITRHGTQDYLVSVPCSCIDVNVTRAYFYDTSYQVQPNDTFFNVSNQIYSGQAFDDGEEQQNFIAGKNTTLHLLCGCLENGQSSDEDVVTYTVQEGDTLFSIAELLSSQVQEIERLNKNLANNPNLLQVGWVLYVPMKNSTQKGL